MKRGMYQIWNAARTAKFQEDLLGWYAAHRRHLPWRTDPDPYRVWISEIMLQQTQVRTVLPYFERFIDRFPDVCALAAASEAEVLALWAGLGYYGRARNLRRAALEIVQRHAGRFPCRIEDIARLPGVGRYTAGAVASIAFNQPEPIVDGNVRRVISRLHALEGGAAESFYWEQARAWIPAGRASDFNQAVMELGALICTPSSPSCLLCPVAEPCEARRRGLQERIPPPRRTRAPERKRLVMLVAQHGGDVLLVRERDASYIPGEWGLPTNALPPGASAAEAARSLVEGLSLDGAALQECATVRHGVTYRRIEISVFRARLDGGPQPQRADSRWIARAGFDAVVTSSAYRKAIEVVNFAVEARPEKRD
jgi:A/G-specific adenine glycosylase